MALALGVKNGSNLMIGSTCLHVESVQGLHIVVDIEGRKQVLSDEERREVMPDVWVSTARGKHDDGRTRLLFEAPRSIKIMRVDDVVANQ